MIENMNGHTLRTVVAIVNSGPEVDGVDLLASIVDLSQAVEEWVVTDIPPITIGDLEDVRSLRDRLRPVFTSPDDETREQLINELLSTATVQPRLVSHDHLGRHIHYFPLQARIAEHLQADCGMTLAIVLASGQGRRLRECSAPDCGRVFVDVSRNANRRYCDSRRCGNRINAAAYRARQRSS
ncbi:putative RNA-binding Zn ribbon-like protein [Kribbella aluminosa]|uniref:RNA-binding Zn ribbon-like protein n=1 Tax=Kribbella aluminosa TaxID=416017 RepID=A0ABS4UTM4_9ACTN|nr:CGNR zinc finger domain-containing protein [Kribbella aluminosa]MBP2354996.1 putative RNA-binding Zn ribbon-like protein [Kribbella aluminosa]